MRNVWDSVEMRKMIYGERMLARPLPDAYEMLESHWPKSSDPVASAREFEWHTKMVNDLLWQEDRCSMAEGLEVRVPFVDYRLKQAVDQLSRKQLMVNGQLKGYMKSMVSSILPEAVISRRKSGFQVDSPSFFNSHLRPLSEQYLSPQKVRDYGLFNPKFVTQLLALPERKRYRWHYFMLYLMLVSHIWIELFEKNATYRR
jgi:asparagine synthase (glutamine-hydrolysing)